MTSSASLLPPLTEPLLRRRFVDRAWLAFVEDGTEPTGLPPEIVRSWRRARESYVDWTSVDRGLGFRDVVMYLVVNAYMRAHPECIGVTPAMTGTIVRAVARNL
jgi:hypothetical protein